MFLTPTFPSVIRPLRQYLIFSLTVLFLLPFGMRFVKKKLNKLSSCGCLSLKYREIILGFLTGETDLQNYVLILGKTYLWTCRCKETKPSFSHFERIFLNKYATEKYISFKSNNIDLFKKKWRIFEEMFLLIKSTSMLKYVLYKLYKH